jgi:hypothetical protein
MALQFRRNERHSNQGRRLSMLRIGESTIEGVPALVISINGDQMDVVQEFADMSAGLCAAIRTMTGARRRRAEARLSRSIEALVADHAPYVTFIHSKVSEPVVIDSDFKLTELPR